MARSKARTSAWRSVCDRSGRGFNKTRCTTTSEPSSDVVVDKSEVIMNDESSDHQTTTRRHDPFPETLGLKRVARNRRNRLHALRPECPDRPTHVSVDRHQDESIDTQRPKDWRHEQRLFVRVLRSRLE